jgi:hypothetical protein
MKKTFPERLTGVLSGWVITRIGIIDKYRYLVIAEWGAEKTPYVSKKDNKKYPHPTAMLVIDLQNEGIRRLIDYGGFSHGYCDGGIINGNKEAFFGSYNGITYHLDYDKDTFEHEELLMTSKRREEGMSRGISSIKLLGNHFYTGESGNRIHRRDAAKKWTLVSKEAREYFKKLESNKILTHGRVNAFDGFSEQEIYFAGKNANLWYVNVNEQHCEKIVDLPDPENIIFKYVICGNDKVYAIDSHGAGVAVGRHGDFTYYPMKEDDPANGEITFGATFFNGKLYLARNYIFEFKDDHWVIADIPGIYGGVEHLAAKDGVMFIATPYSLKIYNGKETQTLYGEEKETAILVTKGLFKTSTDFLEKGHDFLDELAGQDK